MDDERSKLEVNERLEAGCLALVDEEDQQDDDHSLSPVRDICKPFHIAVLPCGWPPVHKVSEDQYTENQPVG